MDSELLYLADEDEIHEIDVTLLLPDRLPIKGRVYEVYVDGVGARLPKRAGVPVGERVRLALSVDPDERPVTLTALVRTRREAPTYRRYGFRFVSREEIEEKLPQGLYSIFNRRRAERFTLTEQLPVTLSPMHTCAPVLAKLHGASRTGCSLLVDPKSEATLAATEQLILTVDQPVLRVVGSKQTPAVADGRAIPVLVHNRLLMGSGDIRYGCEFDPYEPGDKRSVELLVDYLLQREQRLRAG